MTSIGELRRRTLETLSRPSYSIAKKDMVLLNDNANLFGVNPAVMDAAEEFDFSRLWAYPSENSDSLRDRIASEYGLSPTEVIVGNGSDELLDIVSKTFINPGDRFCSPSPTFGMYRFYARVNLATICEVLLRPDFSMDVDQILAQKAKLTAICQPNNPTANLFGMDAIRTILTESEGVVMVDEAYSDFSGTRMIEDVMTSSSALDIRTFSKAYGLAGLRAGFALAREETINELRRVRTPFGLNSFTEAVAIKAMDNGDWVKAMVVEMKSQRTYLDRKLRAMGFETYPSVCNFVIAKCPIESTLLVSALRDRGIAIRDCSSFPMMKDHIRVTVGPRDLLDRFLEVLNQLVTVSAK